MPQPIATVDTSALVSLHSAALLGAVSVLFDRVLVPTRVREELSEGATESRQALRALEGFAIFEQCNDYDHELVRLLLDTRKQLKEGKDQGEAEAVIQAAQRSAHMVLTDDHLGRLWAAGHSIECHGALWVCHELRRTGYLSELRPRYVAMLQHGRRQPLRDINVYLAKFGEEPITQRQLREYFSRGSA